MALSRQLSDLCRSNIGDIGDTLIEIQLMIRKNHFCFFPIRCNKSKCNAHKSNSYFHSGKTEESKNGKKDIMPQFSNLYQFGLKKITKTYEWGIIVRLIFEFLFKVIRFFQYESFIRL